MVNSDDVHVRSYSFNQESIRKDIERLFGILQSRFEILRRENRRWELHETIRISNCCVILHNIMVRLSTFRDKNYAQPSSTDLHRIMQTEYRNAQQSSSEMDTNETEQAEHVLHNINDESDRLLLRDIRFTDQGTHQRLQTDLVQLNKERRMSFTMSQ